MLGRSLMALLGLPYNKQSCQRKSVNRCVHTYAFVWNGPVNVGGYVWGCVVYMCGVCIYSVCACLPMRVVWGGCAHMGW